MKGCGDMSSVQQHNNRKGSSSKSGPTASHGVACLYEWHEPYARFDVLESRSGFRTYSASEG